MKLLDTEDIFSFAVEIGAHIRFFPHNFLFPRRMQMQKWFPFFNHCPLSASIQSFYLLFNQGNFWILLKHIEILELWKTRFIWTISKIIRMIFCIQHFFNLWTTWLFFLKYNTWIINIATNQSIVTYNHVSLIISLWKMEKRILDHFLCPCIIRKGQVFQNVIFFLILLTKGYLIQICDLIVWIWRSSDSILKMPFLCSKPKCDHHHK